MLEGIPQKYAGLGSKGGTQPSLPPGIDKKASKAKFQHRNFALWNGAGRERMAKIKGQICPFMFPRPNGGGP